MNNKEDIEHHIKAVMILLGMDIKDDSLKDTPKRVAKAYVKDIFSGMNPLNEPKMTMFDNKYQYDQMITLCNIECFSMCEHHLLPFPMTVSIGYIPSDKIVGLSKLARIADYFAKRPQVQERFTQQVMDFIVQHLDPKGVIVLAEGRHMCMQMRGVEKTSAVMTTSSVKGLFREEQALEMKFLDLVRNTKR